jgi:hypothetical protein
VLPSTNKVEVKLHYGELTPIVRWCERNCIREWSYLQLEPPGEGKGEYEFYFEDEQDLVAFTIWKT